jgi:hypothetical protein
MEQSQLLAHCGSSKITREELKVIPTPTSLNRRLNSLPTD